MSEAIKALGALRDAIERKHIHGWIIDCCDDAIKSLSEKEQEKVKEPDYVCFSCGHEHDSSDYCHGCTEVSSKWVPKEPERRDWVVLYANGKYDIFMDHTLNFVEGQIESDDSIIPYKPVKEAE